MKHRCIHPFSDLRNISSFVVCFFVVILGSTFLPVHTAIGRQLNETAGQPIVATASQHISTSQPEAHRIYSDQHEFANLASNSAVLGRQDYGYGDVVNWSAALLHNVDKSCIRYNRFRMSIEAPNEPIGPGGRAHNTPGLHPSRVPRHSKSRVEVP